MATWQVQEAKSRFSELLEEADRQGPQIITRHGAERSVVLSIEEYRKLTEAPSEPKLSFRDYLLSGPKVDDFEIERSKDTGREIDL